MKHGVSCTIHKKNGNLLNGKYHNQYHHHPEAKYLEYMLVKVILWWTFFNTMILSITSSTLKVKLNTEMYINIFHRLKDAVRRKRPEKWRTNSWFLLQENAPAHRSALVKDFLAKNNVTTLEYPPYSIDVAAADLYLFPWMKSALKGRRMCDGIAEKVFTEWLPGTFLTRL